MTEDPIVPQDPSVAAPVEVAQAVPSQEHRSLVTIMFIDAVDFSKLSGKNEAKTFAAVNRDFNMMKALAQSYSGQVVNEMGDAILVVFQSAVSAMECAIQIQQRIHAQSLQNPPDGVLDFRIGLHVGDIIIDGTKVFGDGVNTASRIQSAAKPGGIFLSEAVHELVKTKVKLSTAKYVGKKMLKNIAEPVKLWEIPPIEDALKAQMAEDAFAVHEPKEFQGATGRRGFFFLFAAILMLGLAFASLTMLRGVKVAENSFGKGSISLKDKQKLKDKLEKDGTQATNEPAPVASNEATNPPPVATPNFALTPDQINQLSQLAASSRFDEAVTLLQSIPGADSAEGQAMIAKYNGVLQFKAWLNKEVAAATGETPIIAVSVEGEQIRVYSTAAGVVIDTQQARGEPRDLWSYKSQTLVAIAQAARTTPPTRTQPPAQLDEWIEAFRALSR